MPKESEPYAMPSTDRLAVNRLRTAAKRGDARAQATLDDIEQQKHTTAWEAAEQHRADLAAEREERNRQRPKSVTSAMETHKRTRAEKQARHQAYIEQTKEK